MNIAEQLKRERQSKITEYAKEFAQSIKPEIVESAKKGYTGYNISIENREDAHILKATEFHDELEKLLEGCKVSVKVDEYKGILPGTTYFKYKLNISWI